MACRSVAMRSMLLSEQPWHLSRSAVLASSPPILRRRGKASFGAALIRCSRGNAPSPASPQDEQDPPQEAILKAISEVSKAEGRVAQTTNVVIGGTVVNDSTDEWLVLDKKVNSYPTVRRFTAIGTGGDEFVQAMVVAVESVIQESIPKLCRSRRSPPPDEMAMDCHHNYDSCVDNRWWRRRSTTDDGGWRSTTATVDDDRPVIDSDERWSAGGGDR